MHWNRVVVKSLCTTCNKILSSIIGHHFQNVSSLQNTLWTYQSINGEHENNYTIRALLGQMWNEPCLERNVLSCFFHLKISINKSQLKSHLWSTVYTCHDHMTVVCVMFPIVVIVLPFSLICITDLILAFI